MGGRGSNSGFRAGGGVTQEQQTIMKRFEKKLSESWIYKTYF